MDQDELFRIIRKDLGKLEGFIASMDAGEVNSQRQVYGIQIVDNLRKLLNQYEKSNGYVGGCGGMADA